MEKEKLKDQAREWYTHGVDGNRQTWDRMTKCEEYGIGRQWDPDVLEANRARRKFSLTIPLILPVINHLSGFEARNPQEIKAVNLRSATAKGAQIVSALTKHAFDTAFGPRVANQTFEDGIRCGRGFIGYDIDYADDPLNGTLKMRKYDPFMVIPDPDCKTYDYNDVKNGAKWIIVDDWWPKKQIEQHYPGRRRELEDADSLTNRAGSGVYSTIINFIFGSSPRGTEDTYRKTHKSRDIQDADRAKFNYRITTVWWKEYRKGALLKKAGDDVNYLPLWNQTDIKRVRDRVEENGDVELLEKDKAGKPIVLAVLHKSVFVGTLLLEDVVDPFNGIMLLPIFRYSPYYVNGYEFSVVDNLIGVQDQINWSWSMELNLIRQMANRAWKITRDTTGKFKRWLEDHGGEDGIVIDENEGGGKVDQFESSPFPTGYDRITARGAEFIREISQVALTEPQKGGKESGKAIALKDERSKVTTSNLYANWDYTLRLFGVGFMQVLLRSGVYSDDEIESIVDEEDLIDAKMLEQARAHVKRELAGQGIPALDPPQRVDPVLLQSVPPDARIPMVSQVQLELQNYAFYMKQVDRLAIPIAKAMLLDEIRGLRWGKYAVKTELAAHSETYRVTKALETFQLHSVLVNSGQPGIERKQLIEATDVPNKEEIIKNVPRPVAQPVGAK